MVVVVKLAFVSAALSLGLVGLGGSGILVPEPWQCYAQHYEDEFGEVYHSCPTIDCSAGSPCLEKVFLIGPVTWHHCKCYLGDGTGAPCEGRWAIGQTPTCDNTGCPGPAQCNPGVPTGAWSRMCLCAYPPE